MAKRYHHQILVTELCFTSRHLDDIQDKALKRYMHHELFMMFGISIIFTRLNRSAETDAALEAMWERCAAFDAKWTKHFKNRTLLWFITRPGRHGQNFTNRIYRTANKIVRFN